MQKERWGLFLQHEASYEHLSMKDEYQRSNGLVHVFVSSPKKKPRSFERWSVDIHWSPLVKYKCVCNAHRTVCWAKHRSHEFSPIVYAWVNAPSDPQKATTMVKTSSVNKCRMDKMKWLNCHPTKEREVFSTSTKKKTMTMMKTMMASWRRIPYQKISTILDGSCFGKEAPMVMSRWPMTEPRGIANVRANFTSNDWFQSESFTEPYESNEANMYEGNYSITYPNFGSEDDDDEVSRTRTINEHTSTFSPGYFF